MVTEEISMAVPTIRYIIQLLCSSVIPDMIPSVEIHSFDEIFHIIWSIDCWKVSTVIFGPFDLWSISLLFCWSIDDIILFGNDRYSTEGIPDNNN